MYNLYKNILIHLDKTRMADFTIKLISENVCAIFNYFQSVPIVMLRLNLPKWV